MEEFSSFRPMIVELCLLLSLLLRVVCLFLLLTNIHLYKQHSVVLYRDIARRVGTELRKLKVELEDRLRGDSVLTEPLPALSAEDEQANTQTGNETQQQQQQQQQKH